MLVNFFFLYIKHINFSGFIAIVLCLHAAFLYLLNNQLSGSIPSSLGNLNVSYLYLNNNQLSGSIPSSLGNLINLAFLLLNNNQLSGSIPSSFGNLVHLYDLDLSSNQLSGSIPSSFGNLVNLNSLYVNNNQLSGSIPFSLGNLVNLYYLNLSHNKLSGKIPLGIANLQALRALRLSDNRFTFNGMELIAQTFSFAIYGNQALIPVHQNGKALSVSAGGTLSNNTYQWFRVGQTGHITIAGDSVSHPSQSGKYFARVFNSVATQLILKSDTIKYVAPAELNEPAIASSENGLQEQDKTNLFLIYPNPAKNILHVQTNGNESFSLLNQNGKILLTTNINSNGSINISGMAAGLYYLKNNSTGAVKKVIIAR
jgi:hypothetical protein